VPHSGAVGEHIIVDEGSCSVVANAESGSGGDNCVGVDLGTELEASAVGAVLPPAT